MPTAKKWKRPVCTPWAIRNVTFASGKSIRPTSASVLRIRTVAAQARAACPSPWNHSSSASPPNLSRLAPFS